MYCKIMVEIGLILGRRGDGKDTVYEYKVRMKDADDAAWIEFARITKSLGNLDLLARYDAELSETKVFSQETPGVIRSAVVVKNGDTKVASPPLQGRKGQSDTPVQMADKRVRKPHKKETLENCRARKQKKRAAMTEEEKFLVGHIQAQQAKTRRILRRHEANGKPKEFLDDIRAASREGLADEIAMYREMLDIGYSVEDIKDPRRRVPKSHGAESNDGGESHGTVDGEDDAMEESGEYEVSTILLILMVADAAEFAGWVCNGPADLVASPEVREAIQAAIKNVVLVKPR